MSTEQIIQLVGGLAIFLYGMKLMSEALQQVAGDELKQFLARMTRTRLSGIFSGAFVTMMIQSSSATTVMLVSFVNAGLINLVQAIGVIMGANIGTTVTAWMIAFLGFKVKIANFALPAIALGMGLLFVKRTRISGWGPVLTGFGFLFLGLKFLKDSIPSVAKNPESFVWLEQLNDLPAIVTILVFILVGTLLTIVIQSSSATTTITITLAFTGTISYSQAAAMILGENIGTTITANIAALTGNINAKRTALAHSMFNIIGVTWAVIAMIPLLWFVDLIIPGNPLTDHESTRFHLSGFHTTFNVLNTLMLFGLAPFIARWVIFISRYLYPKSSQMQTAELENMSSGPVGTSQLSVLELADYFKRNMVQHLDELSLMHKLLTDSKRLKKTEKEIVTAEQKVNDFTFQILRFVNSLQLQGIGGKAAQTLGKISDRVKSLEEIGDQCAKIARKMRRAKKEKEDLPDTYNARLALQFEKILEQYQLIRDNMDSLDSRTLATKAKTARRKAHQEHATILDELSHGGKGKGKLPKNTNLAQAMLFNDITRYLDYISQELEWIVVGKPVV